MDNGAGTGCSKKAILIVDDEEPILDMLELALGQDYELYRAESAEEGFDILKAHRIQVVLCDHHLSGEDGLSLLKRLGDSNTRIQRLLITGDKSNDLILKAMNEGSLFQFIPKPFTLEQIRSVVSDAVREYGEVSARQEAEKEGKRLKEQRSHYKSGRLFSYERVWPLMLHLFSLLAAFIIFIFGAGIVAILLLYFLKSALGIDLLQHAHFGDLFR